MEAALERKKREHPPRERILDGEGEAQLVRIACSAPPEGQARWSLALLADSLVELKVVEAISPQTVMRTLKSVLKPHLRTCWVIPPEHNAEFVTGRNRGNRGTLR